MRKRTLKRMLMRKRMRGLHPNYNLWIRVLPTNTGPLHDQKPNNQWALVLSMLVPVLVQALEADVPQRQPGHALATTASRVFGPRNPQLRGH